MILLTIETEDPANITADKETVISLTEKADPGRNITEDANRSTWVQAVLWLTVHNLKGFDYSSPDVVTTLDQETIDLPTLEETEAELEAYLEGHTSDCIDRYQGYNGFSLRENNPSFDVTFTDEHTIVRFEDIFVADKEDTSVSSGRGSFEVPIRYKYILEEVRQMLIDRIDDKYKRGAKGLDNLNIEVIKKDGEEIWLITDIKGEPYNVLYLISYTP